jgi:hypothetical protein
MDELQRIAERYFNRFEGMHLYPRWNTFYWFVWASMLICLLVSIYYLFDPEWMKRSDAVWVTLFFEIVFLFTYLAISEHKKRELHKKLGLKEKATSVDVDMVRSAELCKEFATSSREFARLARECRELMAVSESMRSPADTAVESLWRGVHDPDRKARLTGIIWGALAILVSLLVVGLPADSPTFLELLAADEFGDALWFLMALTAIVFGLWKALQWTWFNLVEMAWPWAARFAGGSSFAKVKINYLVRDLVRLHMPVDYREEPPRAPRFFVRMKTKVRLNVARNRGRSSRNLR